MDRLALKVVVVVFFLCFYASKLILYIEDRGKKKKD